MAGIQGIKNLVLKKKKKNLVLFTPMSKVGHGPQQIFANGMNEERKMGE